MKKYLLSVYLVEGQEPPAEGEIEQIFKDVDNFNQKVTAADRWVFGGGLYPVDTATVVKPKGDGDVLTTDGPFAEAKEHIGGFWIIKAHDLDDALDWGRQAALACHGPVEVRPFEDELDED